VAHAGQVLVEAPVPCLPRPEPPKSGIAAGSAANTQCTASRRKSAPQTGGHSNRSESCRGSWCSRP
jgi:hypothetical protein